MSFLALLESFMNEMNCGARISCFGAIMLLLSTVVVDGGGKVVYIII